MKSFEYTITDEIGIHARPARKLSEESKKYRSKIVIKKNGQSVEISRLMALMRLSVKCGQTVTVEVTGDDEVTASEEMMKFFKENL